MKSPITGKEMELVREPSALTFRKEEFPVSYHYYLCRDTGEQFTDDKIDAINMVQVHNQYREKYRIPFPEEISGIREKYGLSASKMSEILGLGTNTYRLYEAGEMPSVSNGRLILSVKDPLEFIKQVRASSHILTEREMDRFIATANAIYKMEQDDPWNRLFEEKIFAFQEPNEYTGYREPNLQKVADVISFFSQSKIDLFKTKLNKLLFYSDFCAYRETGYSITGVTYKAIPFGPVPDQYDKLYIRLCDDDKLVINQHQFSNGNYAEEIVSRVSFDESSFTTDELEILNTVVKTFKSKNTTQVVNISHNEKAWVENQDGRNLLSYQKYAFSIGAL